MKYHIEFSERGSGKTSKLLYALNRHLEDTDDNVILITPNQHHSAGFQSIMGRFGNRIRYSTDPTANSLLGVRGRRFFDEFVSNSNLMNPEFRGQDGDYYCSSLPKGEAEIDVMVKVLSLYDKTGSI